MTQRIMVLSYLMMTCCASAQPTVIAHRGASGYLPEHSLPAVSAAHLMNVDYIEQDVVLSKDGIPVILHDIHLETVTDVEQKFPNRKRKDGRYYAIDFLLKELKKLNLHERANADGTPVFQKRFPLISTGLKIPTLDEEVSLIQGMNKSRQKNIGLYVELKAPAFHNAAGFNMEEIVLKTLKARGYQTTEDKIFLQSFDPESLKKLKSMTSIRLIQLVGLNSWNEADVDYEKMMTPNGLESVAEYAQGIGPYIGYFLNGSQPKNSHLIQKAKDLGLEIHAYTFRSDALPEGFESFDALIKTFSNEIGISGFFSDQPDKVLKILQK